MDELEIDVKKSWLVKKFQTQNPNTTLKDLKIFLSLMYSGALVS
jgi:hypothetical protein